MDANIEQIEKWFNLLKKNFDDRYNKSDDKETLLKNEIQVHELLFDDNKLQLLEGISSNWRPLLQKGLSYTDGDIVSIRDAYIKYIVNGVDINDTGKYFVVRKESINKEEDDWYIDGKGRFCKKMPPTNIEIHFYTEAKIRYSYLNWLRNYNIPKKEKENLSLGMACKGLKEYESIRTWFIDNKFCDPVTFVWNEKFTLSCLAGYLKDLNKKGYTNKLIQLEMIAIAKNSFHAEMKIDTMKSAKKLPPEIPPFKD